MMPQIDATFQRNYWRFWDMSCKLNKEYRKIVPLEQEVFALEDELIDEAYKKKYTTLDNWIEK